MKKGLLHISSKYQLDLSLFTWNGTATDVSIADLPPGLISEKDAVAKTLKISGSPTAPETVNIYTRFYYLIADVYNSYL